MKFLDFCAGGVCLVSLISMGLHLWAHELFRALDSFNIVVWTALYIFKNND